MCPGIQKRNDPGGLDGVDGVRGVWLALLILGVVIIRTFNDALTTFDPQNQRFEPTTMHYYTTIDPKKSKIRTHDHALHHH
jgi:hypothetical protein